MSGRKRIQICPSWLLNTAAAIQEGKTTIMEACKTARVIIYHKHAMCTFTTRRVSQATVKRALEVNGINISLKKGRPRNNVLEEHRQKIIETQKRLKMGVSKTYYQIVSESASVTKYQEISHQMVYDTLQENNLISFKKPLSSEETYRCRYEASNPDLIWHTDLHNFNDQYLRVS